MIKICNMLFEFHNAWGNVQDLYILRLIYVPITTAFVFLFSERALLLMSLWYLRRPPDLTRAPSSSSCWPCSVSVWGDTGRGQAQSRGEYLCSVGGDTGRGLAQSTGEYLCSIVVGAKENTWQGQAQPRGEILCSVGGGWVWRDRIIQPRGQYLLGVGAKENTGYWAGTSTATGWVAV